MTNIRIGQGYDVHAFGAGEQITLGGVSIPHTHGLIAHSDGDVLLHALTDAVLGALALGDIGKHFPDTDPAFAGVDSRALLRGAVSLANQAGWSVANADMTVIAQQPKMAPHIEIMRSLISDDLGVELNAVSVKATTTEKLGFVGRHEGIAAQAVVLLARD
jgi:2-C-methyl-D-erythritol 2,4-cyclodiphosphate synthase